MSMYDNLILSSPHFFEGSRRTELEEDTLQLKQRHKFLNDAEEMEYWYKHFGFTVQELEPENIDEPF